MKPLVFFNTFQFVPTNESGQKNTNGKQLTTRKWVMFLLLLRLFYILNNSVIILQTKIYRIQLPQDKE